MPEMTISEAIEVLNAHNEFLTTNTVISTRNGIAIVDDETLQALDKAVEVMEAYIQIGNVKPYHRAIK